MKKIDKNTISRILEMKSRYASTSKRWEHFSERFDKMLIALTYLEKAKLDANNEELYKYFPIGAIACLQGHFRLVVSDLIDHGAPYLERAGKLTDVNFKLDSILAIHEKKVSVGEIISHILSVNDLNSEISYLETLIGDDFKDQLNKVEIEVSEDKYPFSIFADYSFENVSKAFEYRHIFCHELAPSLAINFDEARHCLGAVMAVQLAIELLVWELIGK